MAGTVTVQESSLYGIQKIRWAWTATAGGAADKATTGSYFGEVLALFTNPDDTLVPTDNYDITVTDAEGHDVLLGAGANRDTANNESAAPTTPSVAFGVLTLNVTNAGNATAGVAILYLRGTKAP